MNEYQGPVKEPSISESVTFLQKQNLLIDQAQILCCRGEGDHQDSLLTLNRRKNKDFYIRTRMMMTPPFHTMRSFRILQRGHPGKWKFVSVLLSWSISLWQPFWAGPRRTVACIDIKLSHLHQLCRLSFPKININNYVFGVRCRKQIPS